MSRVVTWLGGPKDGEELTIPDGITRLKVAILETKPADCTDEKLIPTRTVSYPIKGKYIIYYDPLSKEDK